MLANAATATVLVVSGASFKPPAAVESPCAQKQAAGLAVSDGKAQAMLDVTRAAAVGRRQARRGIWEGGLRESGWRRIWCQIEASLQVSSQGRISTCLDAHGSRGGNASTICGQ